MLAHDYSLQKNLELGLRNSLEVPYNSRVLTKTRLAAPCCSPPAAKSEL